MDLSRREFTVLGVSALSSSNLQLDQQGQPNQEFDFQGVAFLYGPNSAKPASDDPFWNNKIAGVYFYETYESTMYVATVQNKTWTPIDWTNNVYVTSAQDLPEATNGTHTLENKVYWFNGFVFSDYGLDISNSPILLGRHAGYDGFIHTGTNTAITGSGGNYLQDSLYVHAPGGTIYDISGDQSTEMLVTDSAFSDAGGIGDIVSLGTVTGFRVPTWKNCNFEDFASGLTFDGNPDKIFISSSPFRNITASNVDLLTLSSTADVAIVDFVDNYIKDVQSDTVVWRVEDGAEPSEVFQYRGTVHDTSFNLGNAIVGPNASPTEEPFWVSDSHPVRDSSVAGELSLTQETTVEISVQDEWYRVNGVTQTGNESERTTQATDGVIEYIGSKETNVQLSMNTSFTGANGRTYQIAVAKNGTVEPASSMEAEANGPQSPINPSTSAIEDLRPGDTISLQVRNRDGTEDATFRAYNINFLD